MTNESKFPKIKKKLVNFLKDEEGTILRSKAAIVGPVAAGTVLLMSKEITITAEALKFSSHASHRSHSSHSSWATGSHVSHSNGSTVGDTNHASHSNTLPSHSSHSSGTTSGFSHTASTFEAEARNAENN